MDKDMARAVGSTDATGLSQAEPEDSLGRSGFDPSRGGRFRKLPIVIEAFQWTNQDRNDWPEWAAEDDRLEDLFGMLIGISVIGLKVHTPEGPLKVSHGDWIVRGVKGELYPCKPDIFAASYEHCDSDGSPKGGDACGSVHDSAGRNGIAEATPGETP